MTTRRYTVYLNSTVVTTEDRLVRAICLSKGNLNSTVVTTEEFVKRSLRMIFLTFKFYCSNN